MSSTPVRYAPSVETVAPDEAETIAGLNESFQEILETTSQDYGHAVRAVHAKAHGIARGTLTVGHLPPQLAQGIFAAPGTYEAVIRISTNAGDILDDSVSLPRGVALKVIGVQGDRLPDSGDSTNQDFIMVNGPAFSAPDAKAFGKNLKLLSKTTDRFDGVKKAMSATFRVVESALEAVGGESATLKTLGGAAPVHPLGETYYSQTPFRFGDYIAKFALFPVSPGLTRLTGDLVNVTARPDALREVVRDELIEHGGTWELRVQLNTDLDAMPVEDASVVWDEKQSPFVTVATLEVPAQLSWAPGTTDKTDDALVYSVWDGVTAHQPLGGINRARKSPYELSSTFRGQFNGCPVHQPKSLSDLV
ncbi:catalase family protein [Sphingomonas ginsenosidivorax]|uniref:Catalase family protein n=1 Tax=Sphingomonas ginsenosidivorax TaxID=862135 RepID=A0A5C6UGV8_9SPHN|nr:catalase family protein [Sphingomonas ginsenosidivorax]TXC71471.1 catalase family protein [Sphingomonas ginsenosidivorax]